MRPRQKVSRAGIALIEGFEGLRLKAARLPDGRWTIGYGHTRSAREGAEVSAADAEALLIFDLTPVVAAVNDLVFVELSQNQFDAVCAFAFNVGVETFRSSDVLKRINEGRLTEAACEFDLWRKAEVAGDPMVLDALIRRRAAEKALFLTSASGFVPTPSPLVRPSRDIRLVEALPTSAPQEIEIPLEGPTAEVRHVAPAPVAETAPQPEPEPHPAPVATVVTEPPTTAPAPAMPSADALSYFAPETAFSPPPPPEPLSPPEPEPVLEPVADAVSEPVAIEPPAFAEPPVPAQDRTLAEQAKSAARIYGPMGAAALGRGRPATPANEDVLPALDLAPDPAPPQAPEPAADVAPEPASFSPPLVELPPIEPRAAPPPAPPAEPLILTHPPEDWEPRRPAPEPETSVATDPAESDPTLFSDGWGGGAATRVVRHEEGSGVPQKDAQGSARFVVMAIIGLVASGGAIFAFLKGRAVGGGDLATYAWLLAVIGALCVATSVYFLLKRLGGVED